jgi:regulator of cell morphogenesis and NO signaling
VKEIVKAKNNGTPYLRNTERGFSEIVATSEQEHESVGDAIKEIRSLSDNFTVPADGCTSYRLLFKMLEEFENDLFIHIHLENNILFPKAEVIENSLA